MFKDRTMPVWEEHNIMSFPMSVLSGDVRSSCNRAIAENRSHSVEDFLVLTSALGINGL